MTPADRLKAARHALGYSVEAMADALHLRGDNAGDDVRNWERGRREPSGVVVRCAEALAVIDELLTMGVQPEQRIIDKASAFLGAEK